MVRASEAWRDSFAASPIATIRFHRPKWKRFLGLRHRHRPRNTWHFWWRSSWHLLKSKCRCCVPYYIIFRTLCTNFFAENLSFKKIVFCVFFLDLAAPIWYFKDLSPEGTVKAAASLKILANLLNRRRLFGRRPGCLNFVFVPTMRPGWSGWK